MLFETLHEAQTRLAQGAVIYHDKDFGEESIDCRTELGCLDKCAAQIFPRFEHAVNHGAASLEFLQQRKFGGFLEQCAQRADPYIRWQCKSSPQLSRDVLDALERDGKLLKIG